MPAEARGLVVATRYTLDVQRPDDYFYFPAFVVQFIAPRIIANGARLLAVFRFEDWGLAARASSGVGGRCLGRRRPAA